MADNKQNSETKNTESAANNTPATAGTGAASTKQAKEGNDAPSSSNNKQGNSASSNASQGAGDTIAGVKEATGQAASQVLGQAKEKATSVIDEQKSNLASTINSVADSIRQIGGNLGGGDDKNQVAAIAGKYGDTLAGQVEKFSNYIDERELKELVHDVEQFARRNPALFVGGAFALGILAARFLKSSGQPSRRRS